LQYKAQAEAIAVFGGSFNPVHIGHVALVERLCALPFIRQVLVVPAMRSPFKGGVQMLPTELRWNMLSQALAGLGKVVLSDIEIKRAPPSYTWDTLAELRTGNPGARLLLALGMDAFKEFGGWHRAPELLDLHDLLVVSRAGAGIEAAAGTAPEDLLQWLPHPWGEQLVPGPGQTLRNEQGRPVVTFYDWELPEVSSTLLLASRNVSDVPARARDLLLRYWMLEEGSGA